CKTGCRLRGQTHLKTTGDNSANGSADRQQAATNPVRQPTKLCTVFPNPERDWHNRSGWVVDLTYTRWADSEEDRYWTVDELAARVHDATEQGLHVLVRVDFDKGQTLPPANDPLALEEYLAYVQRLARDERLKDVYGYIIGSGYNASTDDLSPDAQVTPEWYARIFNGYGEPVDRRDNVIQIVRNANPLVRVLAGPIRPWIDDQSGTIPYEINVPWLSYMKTLVQRLEESADAKATIGDAETLPDGFALNAPGRVDAPELGDEDPANEPQTDLKRAEWNGAQAGFRVYQDFLAIINDSAAMQGLPVYISTTNTFTPDEGVPPAQNYPAGWLSSALAEIDANPQIRTLCWFLDLVPGDNQWDAFSLTRRPAKMQDAGDDFDDLLRK
ncbi:MAG: hypothetical protein ACK5NN_08330, partial [Sphingomonadaceae bacterium]